MKSVNIGELKNHLSAYLQHVRNGEEVMVCDRNVPVARIVPIQPTRDEQEAQMVADGLLTLPKQEMDWEAFWAMPRPNVPKDVAVQALIDSRGDR